VNKKVSLIILSFVLAIIVFIISTNMQKQLVNYVPTSKCLVAVKDINEYTLVNSEDFKLIDVPVEMIANIRPIKDISEINDMYLKSSIYKGQLAVFDQFATAEELMIFNGEEGKEKVALKIKGPENGVSYVLKKGSVVNVYATISNEYANSKIFENYEKYSAGSEDYGYSTIKILENVKILGSFDENGEEVEKMPERNIDTILISVLPEESYKVNLIRDIATFNITEL